MSQTLQASVTYEQLVLQNTMLIDAAFEGFGQNGSGLPYQDSGGIWTIGFGTTYLPDGSRVSADTAPIAREQAYAYMLHGVNDAIAVLDQWVKRPLTIGQKAALGSFVYNIGPGIQGERDGFVWLANGAHSTILRCLIAGDSAGAAAQFPDWNRDGGKVLAGLTRRRLCEQGVFTGAVPLRNGVLATLPGYPDADVATWQAEIAQALSIPAAAPPQPAPDPIAADQSWPSAALAAQTESQEYP